MRPSTRTLGQAVLIVGVAALLAFFFNRWRPAPLAWVRSEAFVPAAMTSTAQEKMPSSEPEALPGEKSAATFPSDPTAPPAPSDAPTVSPAPSPAEAPPEGTTPAAPPAEEIPAAETLPPLPPESTSSQIPPSPGQEGPYEDPAPSLRLLADGKTELPLIGVAEALQLHLSGNAIFLDARDPDTYAQGHIPGALCVPPTDLDRLWPQLAPLLEGKTIVTYCDGEACPLSRELAEALHVRGLMTPIVVFGNGWSLWQSEHLPVTTGANP